jgi:hypothetical protein
VLINLDFNSLAGHDVASLFKLPSTQSVHLGRI